MTDPIIQAAEPYRGLVVLPGHVSIFETRAGRGGHRWDGLMLDAVYHDAGLSTVSFADTSTALAVLQANGRIRKRAGQYRIGDAVFLAQGGYVGILTGLPDKNTVRVMLGWWPGESGKRLVRTVILDRGLEVLAVANPDLGVKRHEPTVPVDTMIQIASALGTHPSVGCYVTAKNFHMAYARYQRYCGYGPNKADGYPDVRSLDRLAREARP